MHYSHVYLGCEESQDLTSLKSIVETENELHAWSCCMKSWNSEGFHVWEGKKLALFADLLCKELCEILKKKLKNHLERIWIS
jgi:hypothetical protein